MPWEQWEGHAGTGPRETMRNPGKSEQTINVWVKSRLILQQICFYMFVLLEFLALFFPLNKPGIQAIQSGFAPDLACLICWDSAHVFPVHRRPHDWNVLGLDDQQLKFMEMFLSNHLISQIIYDYLIHHTFIIINMLYVAYPFTRNITRLWRQQHVDLRNGFYGNRLIFVAQEEGDGRCGHGILHRDVCGTSPQVLQQDSDGWCFAACCLMTWGKWQRWNMINMGSNGKHHSYHSWDMTCMIRMLATCWLCIADGSMVAKITSDLLWDKSLGLSKAWLSSM